MRETSCGRLKKEGGGRREILRNASSLVAPGAQDEYHIIRPRATNLDDPAEFPSKGFSALEHFPNLSWF